MWFVIDLPMGQIGIASRCEDEVEAGVIATVVPTDDDLDWELAMALVQDANLGKPLHNVKLSRDRALASLRQHAASEEVERAARLDVATLQRVASGESGLADEVAAAASWGDSVSSVGLAGMLRRLADDSAVDAWRPVLHAAAARLDEHRPGRGSAR